MYLVGLGGRDFRTWQVECGEDKRKEVTDQKGKERGKIFF